MGVKIDLLEYCSNLSAKILQPNLYPDLESGYDELARTSYTQLLIILASSFLAELRKDAQLECFQSLVKQYYSEPVPQSIINAAIYIIANKHLTRTNKFTHYGDDTYSLNLPAYTQVKLGEALFPKRYIMSHYCDSLYENELLPNLLYGIDQLWDTIQATQPITLCPSPLIPCNDDEKVTDLLAVCTKLSYETITMNLCADKTISEAEIKIAELKFKQILFVITPYLLLLSGRWDARTIFEKQCTKYFNEPISLNIVGTAEYIIGSITHTKDDSTGTDYIKLDTYASTEISETIFPQGYNEYHRGEMFYNNILLPKLSEAISNLYEAINNCTWNTY